MASPTGGDSRQGRRAGADLAVRPDGYCGGPTAAYSAVGALRAAEHGLAGSLCKCSIGVAPALLLLRLAPFRWGPVERNAALSATRVIWPSHFGRKRLPRATLVMLVLSGQPFVGTLSVAELAHVYWQLHLLERRKLLFSRGCRVFIETTLEHPPVGFGRFAHFMRCCCSVSALVARGCGVCARY